MASFVNGRASRRLRSTKTIAGAERNPLAKISTNTANVRVPRGKAHRGTSLKGSTTTRSTSAAILARKRSRTTTKAKVEPRRRREGIQKKQRTTEAVNVEVSRLPPGVEDVDAASQGDILFCSEYAHEIFEYYFVRELLMQVDCDYMKSHTDMNPYNRSIVINWMVEVHYGLGLKIDTLFFAVNFLDRYLAKRAVQLSEIQLLGASALALAAKYEEMYYPEMRDYVFAAEESFTKEQMEEMEVELLNVLAFELSVPTDILFLRRFSNAGGSSPQLHCLCKYLIELSLMGYNMLQYNPSTRAAAALYLGRRLCKSNEQWSATLEYYSKHTVNDVMDCARDMNKLLAHARKERSWVVFQKYRNKEYGQVAYIRPLPQV